MLQKRTSWYRDVYIIRPIKSKTDLIYYIAEDLSPFISFTVDQLMLTFCFIFFPCVF